MLVGCVFVYAGLGKAVEGGSGIVGVFGYHGIPPSWHGPLVVALVSIEVSLGLLRLFRQWPRVVEVVVFVVLLAFTVELLWLASSIDAPACGCVGMWLEFESVRASNLWGISRNVVLMTLLAMPWLARALVQRHLFE